MTNLAVRSTLAEIRRVYLKQDCDVPSVQQLECLLVTRVSKPWHLASLGVGDPEKAAREISAEVRVRTQAACRLQVRDIVAIMEEWYDSWCLFASFVPYKIPDEWKM